MASRSHKIRCHRAATAVGPPSGLALASVLPGFDNCIDKVSALEGLEKLLSPET